MTQSDLNRAVARATGETVSRIQRLGFSLVQCPRPVKRPEPPCQVLVFRKPSQFAAQAIRLAA